MTTELLILAPEADEYAELVRRAVPGLSFHAATDAATAQEHLATAEIILGVPSLVAPALAQAPRLRWVQSTYAGVDPLMRPGLRRDYRLSGIKGIFGPLMSEYVFGWILALQRGLFALDQQQRERRWVERPSGSLQGLTFGVAGLGSIGMHLVSTARHFGMRVVGYRRETRPAAGVERVYSGSQIGEFLAECDYAAVTLPNTPQTRHLVDARAIAAMKPSAVLVNVGRGAVVDADSLADALRRKAIGGAVLDVFEQEPLPDDSPLWTLPNCHVTPHISAYSFPADIAKIFLDNLQRYRRGEPLDGMIDFERGY